MGTQDKQSRDDIGIGVQGQEGSQDILGTSGLLDKGVFTEVCLVKEV